MIALFAAMLAERRIIFTSQRLDSLSCCVQAANALLYPMVWQHIFIPILPLTMKEILCAPMPYLIGVPKAVLETVSRHGIFPAPNNIFNLIYLIDQLTFHFRSYFVDDA